MKKILMIALAGLCSACNGHFATVDLPDGGDGKPVAIPNDGIVFYDLVPFKVSYDYTQFVDPKTNVADPPGCVQVHWKDEVGYYPDVARKHALVYSPAWIGSSQLSIGLSPIGTIASINSQNAPATAQLIATAETGLKDAAAAGAIAGLIAEARYTPPPGSRIDIALKGCNASPAITSVTRLNDIADLAN